MMQERRSRLPEWLKKGLADCDKTRNVRNILRDLNLNTVCDHARCPNKGECYTKNVATFMILGDICTRNCGFCAVKTGLPVLPSVDEPVNVARAVEKLGLSYVVVTSVTREDLNDGGASHFADTVRAIKAVNKDIIVEVLIPDFSGNHEALKRVLDSGISVLNHNVETVKELYSKARPQADYYRSLELLEFTKHYRPDMVTKSGLMVGLGEAIEELKSLYDDLYRYKCDVVTVGQYIQPDSSCLNVEKYYTPDEFVQLKTLAVSSGLKSVIAEPLARSSYKAYECYQEALSKG